MTTVEDLVQVLGRYNFHYKMFDLLDGSFCIPITLWVMWKWDIMSYTPSILEIMWCALRASQFAEEYAEVLVVVVDVVVSVPQSATMDQPESRSAYTKRDFPAVLKKSSKGRSGGSLTIIGSCYWLGSKIWQGSHALTVFTMSKLIPGYHTICLARRFVASTPRWISCGQSKTSQRTAVGTTKRGPKNTYSTSWYSCSRSFPDGSNSGSRSSWATGKSLVTLLRR